MPARLRIVPALLAMLVGAALLMAWHRLTIIAPGQSWHVLRHPNESSIGGLLAWQVLLPRLALATLAGAALGLSGGIFQQVLRNPLAEPTTLGISGGAYLAFTILALFWPGMMAARFGVSLAGAVVALGLVLLIAKADGLSDTALILAGVTVNLVAASLGVAFVMLDGGMHTRMLWASGSFAVEGWQFPGLLLGATVVLAPPLLLLGRPLALLALGDEGARGLGVPVGLLRVGALLLAAALAAAVVATCGVIGTIGFVAPLLARLAPSRRAGARLLWTMALGAGLLLLADTAVLTLAGDRVLPEGAAVSLAGAPIFLWMLARLRAVPRTPIAARRAQTPLLAAPQRRLALLAALLLLLAILSLALGRGFAGWRLLSPGSLGPFLIWRLPRLAAAGLSGAMLGGAGALLQTVLRNPLAGPEVLGIGAGASFGVIAAVVAFPVLGHAGQSLAAIAGALATMGTLIWLGRRGGFAASRLLLLGVTLNTLLSGLVALLLTSSAPRLLGLLDWLNGSTYLVLPGDAATLAAFGLPLLAALLLCTRWLGLLSLGSAVAQGLGLAMGQALVLLLLAALLIAGATVVVGPLTFVGLLAPQMARALGMRRRDHHLAGSILLGAIILIAADWIGRVALFPDQLPAGLLASLLGAPSLLWLFASRRSV